MPNESCLTRNHIDLWNERVLPQGAVAITFRTVLRGSLPPMLVWLGIAGFVSWVYSPVVTVVLFGLLAICFLVGFFLRRTAGCSVRCGLYGALGGVLDKSMAGF
ncbi:hypothetical protein [Streptomyces sp. DSM 40750]|uniref:hypothetical protein n=1 Tax=Streptomyces sp. DSM 40750 TaxID=2801030 RepID=UPI00214C15EF|nr:hypothetical protein [Streptomyces sp. DSM 40750]UUU19432.1 hypothetical protein JIX55_03420 [Streptomyces sp. DSM 40750]UUU27224.1 hypothetical protein JIX55_47335 [Streptomyces sp. DSM 40750]